MRLFKRKQREDPFLSDAYRDSLLDRLDVVAPAGTDDETKIMFGSWLMGGVLASNSLLRSIPELAALWTGTREQAEGITRVLSLAMLSRFARWAWPADDPRASESVNASATNVCRFFGDRRPECVAEFLLLNEQFNTDRDFNDRAVSTDVGTLRNIEVELTVGLAARELGRPLAVPISSLDLPLEDWRDLLLAGWKPLGNGLATLLVAPIALAEAEVSMKRVAAQS